MIFLCFGYCALCFLIAALYLTFDICKRFPDLSGNVKKIIDGAGLQNTVRRVVFVPQDALLLVEAGERELFDCDTKQALEILKGNA